MEVRLLKDWGRHKKGDVIVLNDKDALAKALELEVVIDAAEIAEEPKAKAKSKK